MEEQRSHFQWNAGGWFGPQLGGTCWILVAAILTFPRDAGVAAVTLAVFLAANLVGTALWLQRSRLRPFPAMQGLLVLAGLASLLATFVLDRAGHFESLGVGGQVSAGAMYLVILMMVPGLLLFFHLLERNARAAGS